MAQFDRNRQSGPFREPQHLPHVKDQDAMTRLLEAAAQRPDRVPEGFLAYLLDYMRINLLLRDTGLTLSDITANDVSTSKHGFAPKAPNDATKYLDGTGAYSVPVGSGGGSGVAVYRGTGVPSSGVGVLNDLYVNDANGDWYEKQTVPGPPAFRAVSAGAQSSSVGTTTLTVDKPAGVVVGDVMIAVLEMFGNTVATCTATGWTQIQRIQNLIGTSPNGGTMFVLTRTVDGTEGSNFTFTFSSTPNLCVGAISAYSTNGVDTSAQASVASSTSMAAPSVTVAANGGVVICAASGDAASTNLINAATSYTERVEFFHTSSGHMIEIQDNLAASAGVTGTIAVPATRIPSSTPTGLVTIALKAGVATSPAWVRIFNTAVGGDLTGSLPNPTLIATGPGATGPIGSSTVIPVVTIDAKGRVTALTSAAISAGGGAMTQLANTVLGSAAANIDMTSISGSYNHLLLVTYLRTTRVANDDAVLMRFNNDSTAVYYEELIQALGAALAGAESLAATSGDVGNVPAASGTGLRFGTTFTLIPAYANTTNHKSWLTFSVAPWGTATGTIRLRHWGGVWANGTPAAISRITLIPGTGTTFAAGGQATLYGVS